MNGEENHLQHEHETTESHLECNGSADSFPRTVLGVDGYVEVSEEVLDEITQLKDYIDYRNLTYEEIIQYLDRKIQVNSFFL